MEEPDETAARSAPNLGRGFAPSRTAAARYCHVFEEVRYWFRPRQQMKQAVSLAVKRRLFVERFAALQTMTLAA